MSTTEPKESNIMPIKSKSKVTVSLENKSETIVLDPDEEFDEIGACLGLMSGRGYRGYQAWEHAMRQHYSKSNDEAKN